MRKIFLLVSTIVVVLAISTVVSDVFNITSNPSDSRNCDAVIDDNGYVHIVWQDNATGSYKIYYEKIKGGSSSAPNGSIMLSNGSGDAINPAIAIDNNILHIVWQDNRNGNWEIYYEKMTSNGVILEDNYRITNTAGDSINPDISARNGTVFITWVEEGSGKYSIYYDKYEQPPNLPPVANFYYEPEFPDIGEIINFTDNSTDDGEIINFTWNFDDGNTSYERNVSHYYGEEGSYNVTLTVTDEYGLQSTMEKTIVVGEMIRVNKGYNDTTPGWGIDRFASIQDAIDNAGENETIKVYPGVYGSFVINKPLKIVGDPDVDAHNGIGIVISANDIYIENFTVYNASIGVFIHNDSHILGNITLYGFHIYGCNDYGIEIDGTHDVFVNLTRVNDTQGIHMNNSLLTKVANSKLYSNRFGIYLNNSNECVIVKNNITHNVVSGINLDNSSNFNNILENNISFNGANGIRIYHSKNNTIFMNRIYNNTEWGIELSFSNNNTVLENTVSNHTEEWYSAGIVMFYSSCNNNVSMNTVYGNYIDNIEMWDGAEENTVWNNTLWGATYGVLLSDDANNNRIIKNNIFGNEQGIRVGHNASWGGEANNNCFMENMIHNNTYGIFVDISNNNYFSGDTIHDCQYGFYSEEDGINNTIYNITLASYPTTISFFYGNGIALKGVEEYEPNDGLVSINKFVNITNITANSWINITIYYTDNGLGRADESSLALYEWNRSKWNEVPSYLNKMQNFINANITSFSIYGIFGNFTHITIHLYPGWNMVSLPFINNSITKASQLLDDIPDSTVVTRWDSAQQKYISYIDGFGSDFYLVPGEGYFVFVKNESNVTFRGTVPSEINITLLAGYNMIGWTQAMPTNASHIANSIQNCLKVAKWNASSQKWVIPEYITALNGPEFTIETGEGIFVFLGNGSTIWQGM